MTNRNRIDSAAARLCCWVFVVLCVAGPTLTHAADTVETTKNRRSGKVVKMSPTTVTIEFGMRTLEIPVNEIVEIRYDDEPRDLNLARGAAKRGNFSDARERIKAFSDDDLSSPHVREDVEYLEAFMAAREALAGQGDIDAAGRTLHDFVTKHPDNYHYYDATDLITQLLLAAGRYDQAVAYADKLSAAPWLSYQLRADIAKGRIRQAQGEYDEALSAYDAVLARSTDSDDPGVAEQHLEATLGKARCLAALGRGDEGIELVTGVIADADAEDAPRQALAYNALGDCYRALDRKKDALLAYLHVDILYSSQRDAHAEALAHLAELWGATDHADRAADASKRLEENYPQSRWAQQK
ncbi:MAG: tetratricopeptide repeat protein [Pirellulales bacterium]